MSIRTIILDDDANSRKAACSALAGYAEVEIVKQCRTREELFDYLRKEKADLLFLDIELKEELGFAVAEQLRRDYPQLLFIFLTGHASYAIDGYDFQPVNFLTKPIQAKKLDQTIQEVKNMLGHKPKRQRSAQLMFRIDKRYEIVDVQDICYVERRDRKNHMVTTAGEHRIANYAMYELEEMLEPHGFFCCHQAFLISLYRVMTLREAGRQLYEVTLDGCGASIPVSRNRYEELLKRLKEIGVKTV